jgi:hypothetical protein
MEQTQYAGTYPQQQKGNHWHISENDWQERGAIDSYIPIFDRNEICTTKKIEILVKKGVNHPDIDKENLDKEALDILTGWIHNSHFTHNKLNDKCINDVTVDIGKNKDWSISEYLEDCQITIEGDKYVEAITEQYYDDKNIHKAKQELKYQNRRMDPNIPWKIFQNNNKQLW